MAKVDKPEIGAEMYAVFEHLYSNKSAPAVIQRCAYFSPDRTGSRSRDIISWTTLERNCFTRRRRLPPWPKA